MNRVAELESRNEKLQARVLKQDARINFLEEQLRLALFRQFGKSSEQLQGQADLPFDDLKPGETLESVEVQAESAEVTRKKAGRKPLSDTLPRIEELHDLSEQEKLCACGHHLTRIGEDVNEKLVIIPAQVWVQKNIYPKYACRHCQGLSDESAPAVKTASREPDLIPRSILTPQLMAHIWTSKFCDHLPYYRQEAGFARIGADISRQDMVNWTLKLAGSLKPLMDIIDDHIRSGEVIQQDETPVKVLELDRTGKEGKGYMWLARGGPPHRKAVRYRFADGRGHEHPKVYLKGFSGYHQSDAYAAYDLAVEGTDIKLIGCWAHARRKFMDAVKASKSPGAEDALGRIKKLYELDRDCRDTAKKESMQPWDFQKMRKEKISPYLENLRIWFSGKSETTLPESAFGKALSYTLDQWEKLARYLEHPELTPDNNLAENAIRPFVLGRKNWLFSGNDRGAEASCRVFTLIETAKLNGWEPYNYLQTMLTRLPTIGSYWNDLLPWNLNSGKN